MIPGVTGNENGNAATTVASPNSVDVGGANSSNSNSSNSVEVAQLAIVPAVQGWVLKKVHKLYLKGVALENWVYSFVLRLTTARQYVMIIVMIFFMLFAQLLPFIALQTTSLEEANRHCFESWKDLWQELGPGVMGRKKRVHLMQTKITVCKHIFYLFSFL
jgi:hypothetical protein